MEHCYIIEYPDILHCPGKHDSVGTVSTASSALEGHWKVKGSIPGQGRYLSWGFDSQWGHGAEAIDRCTSHFHISLSQISKHFKKYFLHCGLSVITLNSCALSLIFSASLLRK